ncbi:MAG TPA: SUMF1/EgtB/PvdO family nonheme iron enzyme, partial [Anaerolineae bacterium]|nr:SUMF1/EgtB/PvdO family nonheme iron enzyme [Anaerolineae bacterium]
MAANYHLSNIRTLLIEGFSEAELRDFCFDTPEFRPIRHELAELTGKAAIIRHLLEFAERRALLALLLAWAKEQNPAQYTQHQPYELPPPASPSTSSGLGSPPSSPPPRPLRVFLCHASGDKPAVRDLYQRLSGEGFIQPWLDEEELLPGQDWQREIPKAVRAADVVLVCLSPHSITKAGYVQKEIKFALDIADEQPEGTIFLIPLRLEPCDVPERLNRWQWANLFDARGYERLLRSLRQRANAINVTLRPQAEESPPAPPAPKPAQPTATPPPAEKPLANRGTLHAVQHDMEVATATPPDRVTITTPIHLELVRVPAGEFLMGSDPKKDKNASKDEQPQHRVHISEFYIGKYPLTNEQYATFIKATKHRGPNHWKGGKIPSGKENHPVVNVSWDDIVAFCEWLSRESGRTCRLPTEAEWEKAARGTDGLIFPWGNEWDPTRLNSREKGPGDSSPVGKYSP